MMKLSKETCRTIALLVFVMGAVAMDFIGSYANVYIAATGAGTQDGSTCGNAKPLTFLNNGANWGSGGTQIGPDTFARLCGNFTASAGAASYISIQGSGTSGHPITIHWETGAVVQAPYFSTDHTQGAVNFNGNSYVTLDGGTNGILQNTANGTGLANQQISTLISGMSPGSTGNTIKNLAILGVYQQSGTDTHCALNNDWCWSILAQGSNLTIGPGNTFTWCDVCVKYGFNGGESNLRVTGNSFDHVNQALEMGPDNSGVKVMTGVVFDHNTYTARRDWDIPLNYYHHNFFHAFTNTAGSSYTGTLQLYDNTGVGDVGQHSTSMFYLENNNGGGGGTMGPWYIFDNYLNKTNTDAPGSSGIVAVMPPNGFFLNNTVVDAGGTGDFSWPSFNAYGGATGWTVKGNIFLGGGNQIVAQNPATILANNNVYYGGVGSNIFVYHSTFTASIATWQTVCGCDSAATTANPVLQSNGSIGSGSSAIGRGPNLTSLGITALNSDINGSARPGGSTAWDAGAFNSGSTPPPTQPLPPTGITAVPH
jgi:hypothetical protein